MSKEIERKFLVRKGKWQPKAPGEKIRQGYLSSCPERVVRVRTKGEKAYLTVKGKSQGIERMELEYEIPWQDALLLLDICERPLIEKTRYEEEFQGHCWEIDCFSGENAGLVLAEIELSASDEAFALPGWAGEEVSSDPRYYNASLRAHPYQRWAERVAAREGEAH